MPASIDESPYAGDWSIGAFAPPGVIWLGEIPIDQARELIAEGWDVVGAPLPEGGPEETAPPQFDSPPLAEPPPSSPPDLIPPAPEPFTPVGPPASGGTSVETYGDQAQRAIDDTATRVNAPPEPPPFIEGEMVPPGENNVVPEVLGAIARAIGTVMGGPISAGIGAILQEDPLGRPGPEVPNVPPVTIPEPPPIDFPEHVFDSTVPPGAPWQFDRPESPDVIIVTPSTENPSWPTSQPTPPSVPSGPPAPYIDAAAILLPRIWRRHRPVTAPSRIVGPLPTPLPMPSTPPSPAAPPTTWPQPLPLQIPLPLELPGSVTLPTPVTLPQVLTPPLPASVESPPEDRCETPKQRKDRQKKQREDCKKFVTIKVRAHQRKVCVSEAIHHALRTLKRRAKSYVRKELVAGVVAVEGFLGHKPGKLERKAIRKGVTLLTGGKVRLTPKIKRVPLPIEEGKYGLDPNAFLPKWYKRRYGL